MTPAFEDRSSAGRALAELVERHVEGAPCRVFGLARGGVIVARPVAEHLTARLEVLVACKVGAPLQPEYAVGAVAEGGGVMWDSEALRALRIPAEWCESAVAETRAEVERRTRRYRGHAPGVDPSEVAIVVDDGIATGCTVLAALRGLAALGATRRAVATPVASPEALRVLKPEAEWVAALAAPPDFRAVGAHYLEFDPVDDEAVLRALEA
jgi:putative phosphoribosyl transferase